MAPGCGQRLFGPTELWRHCLICQRAGIPLAGCAAGAGGLPEVTCLAPVLLGGLGPGKPEGSYPGRAKAIPEQAPSHLPPPLLLIPLLQGGVRCVEATLHPCTWPVSPAGILSLLLELLPRPAVPCSLQGTARAMGHVGPLERWGRKECMWAWDGGLLTKPNSLGGGFEIPCSASKQLCGPWHGV